jgi:hypothetical protein
MKEAVVLYSGGSDSTLAAIETARTHDRVHLVTFRRLGLHHVENTATNVERLRSLYGSEKFVHEIMDVERLYRHIAYHRYVRNAFRFGFLQMAACGICKLAMHFRALVYALDNEICTVRDGANKGMALEPAQSRPVMEVLRSDLYGKHGIAYENPVYEYEYPTDLEYGDSLAYKLGTMRSIDTDVAKRGTAEEKLYEIGFFSDKTVKGTAMDQGMQVRCFQLVLFNIFAMWYYIPLHGREAYASAMSAFFQEKIAMLNEILARGGREKSSLLR